VALPARHSQSWQAREDAATIKGLQADLEAVIQDNKRFKEELLVYKQRAVINCVASSRRDLIEQVASLQSQLDCARLAAKKEAAAAEEWQASAFNSVIRQLAEELHQVTRQRDDAWARLATLDKSAALNTLLHQSAKPSTSFAARFRVAGSGSACRGSG